MTYTRHKLSTEQDGFVSIVVTMILMVVLGLIVIGFLQIANREQREALDRQLSTQAFYAAESGINDAIYAYNKGAFTGSKTDCSPNALISPFGSVLNANAGISYTCVEIQPALNNLSYPLVTSKSTIVPINSVGLQTLHISWQSTNASSTFSSQFTSGPGSLPLYPKSTVLGGNTGVLAISLIPLDQLDRPNLNTHTLTAFLYPEGTAAGLYGTLDMGVATANPPAHGPSISGKCHVSNAVSPLYACNVLITNLQHNTASGYMMRIRSLYRDSAVNICGNTAPVTYACNSTFTGAQIKVDATGKANDVLRRIQESYPLNPTNLTLPEFALESGDQICKTLQVTNVTPYATDDPDCPTLPKIDD